MVLTWLGIPPAWLVLLSRWAGRWWVGVALVAGTLGAAVTVVAGLWWGPKVLVVGAVATVLYVLALGTHGARLTGVPPRWMYPVLRWAMERPLLSGRTPLGNRWQSMERIQAEYAQSVLDDARRDPYLDQVLDDVAGQLRSRIRGSDERAPNPFAYVGVVAYANGVLNALSETPEAIERIRRDLPPRSEPAVRVAYGSYSPHMLLLAALCRLHAESWARS